LPAARLAFLKGFMNGFMKDAHARAAKDPAVPPELWAAVVPPRLLGVNIRFAEEELTALAAVGAYAGKPVPARMVARILKSMGHYQHMSEASLAKYVLSGPVRTRDGK
jgi:hypothetical protein